MNATTHEGYVKMYKADRGFGFAKVTSPKRPDGKDELDVFFHIKDLERGGIKQVAEGDRLAFNVVHDVKSGRYKAADIKLLVA